jgi:CHAT domain-containing protein
VQATKYILALAALTFFRLFAVGQPMSNASLWHDLVSLDTNQTLSPKDKLQVLYDLKKKADAAQLPQDSVYAKLLHKLGSAEYNVLNHYNAALDLTLQALRINTSGHTNGSTNFASTDLYNIGLFYDNLAMHKKALIYYDSAILYAKRINDRYDVLADTWLLKAYVYFRMGDYEKAAEEAERARTYALQRKDSVHYLNALTQQTQALLFQDKLDAARSEADAAVLLARRLHDDYDLAGALKSQALIFTNLREYGKAQAAFKDCIAARIRSKQIGQVAGDYNDWGVVYGDTLKDLQHSTTCYLTALQYGKKARDSVRMSRASINLGGNYCNQGKLDKAVSCFSQTMHYLRISQGNDFTKNPKASELSAMGNKEMIQSLFTARTELLLALYHQSHDTKWLTACLHTALLNDSLIRDIRHEQIGEQSKLYWRNKTREFFINALNACYLAHDNHLAFYFMEESRSVLLQDKLNELGAHAFLPPAETAKEERLRINIVERQQKQNDFLAAKDSLEQFIHSLEKTYPAYYQYKYADDVKPLDTLQSFLSKHNQTFVDYFIEDSICFALCIRPKTTQFIRITAQKTGIGDQLAQMATLCADENALNRNFTQFLTCSNDVYRQLFEPFHLSGGRVIICQDNYLIPFEALTTDPAKPNFLLNNNAFSYVYSARYLLNQHQQIPGRGDFLGIAPVTFPAYDGLPDLKLSADALRSCSAPYSRRKLLLRGDANRKNFLQQVCDYNTTTILTHARADSADDEPVLFMNDSAIHLSELQLLINPAAKLVILSACQTNVGKNRNGEGIFSLARGFSAAGIPAVAATQWMADETAIYSISQKFNEYVFRGMDKDEALQQAKLYYIAHDKRGSLLPCYWAAMILIGNTDPIQFSPAPKKTGWLIEVGILLALLITFAFFKKFLYI